MFGDLARTRRLPILEALMKIWVAGNGSSRRERRTISTKCEPVAPMSSSRPNKQGGKKNVGHLRAAGKRRLHRQPLQRPSLFMLPKGHKTVASCQRKPSGIGRQIARAVPCASGGNGYTLNQKPKRTEDPSSAHQVGKATRSTHHLFTFPKGIEIQAKLRDDVRWTEAVKVSALGSHLLAAKP